jgi:hypothetical protein
MKRYKQRPLTVDDLDLLRINLSVIEGEVSPEPVCDFCGSLNPDVFLASHTTVDGVEQGCWRWTGVRNAVWQFNAKTGNRFVTKSSRGCTVRVNASLRHRTWAAEVQLRRVQTSLIPLARKSQHLRLKGLARFGRLYSSQSQNLQHQP